MATMSLPHLVFTTAPVVAVGDSVEEPHPAITDAANTEKQRNANRPQSRWSVLGNVS
jgi:hypothetical protein